MIRFPGKTAAITFLPSLPPRKCLVPAIDILHLVGIGGVDFLTGTNHFLCVLYGGTAGS